MAATRLEKRNYFKKKYAQFLKNEMPRKEFRNQLYSEVEIHKKLGLNENSIDSFWEALMEETYDPCLTSVSPRKNKKVKKIKGEKK